MLIRSSYHALDSLKYLMSLHHSHNYYYHQQNCKYNSINIKISLIKAINNRDPKIDP